MQLNAILNQTTFFYVHFVLSVFAMGSGMFSNGYMVAQSVIIALYLWSMIAKENPEPLFLLTYITGMTIVLDAVVIGICWNSTAIGNSSALGFSAAMAIILLILKPVKTILLFNMARQQSGQGTGLPPFGNWENKPTAAQQQAAPVPQYGSYQEQP